MFTDPFETTSDSPTAPASMCFAITPDDFADLPNATKALYVGQGGDITVMPLRSDTPVTFRNVASGAIVDIRVRQVFATDTSAADIIGLA